MIPIIINKKRIAEFLSNYNLGKLLEYKRINSGFANAMIKLKTTKGDHVLKIVIRNNPYRIRYEIDLLNFLKNLPLPKPLEAKNEKYLLDYGPNKAYIYKFIPGRQIIKFSDSVLKRVGALLAKIHLQSKHFKSKVKRFELYTVENRFREMVNRSKKVKNPVIKKNLDYVRQNLPKYFLPKTLPQGAIHTDFKPENTIFLNKKNNGLVDFDNSYRGTLILDLAITVMWFCSNGKLNLNKALLIYRAYNQARKLTKAEKEYFFQAVHYAHISVALICFYVFAVNYRGFVIKEKGYYITNIKTFKPFMKWIINNFLQAEKKFIMSKKEFRKIFN